jgi:hypothetical protein
MTKKEGIIPLSEIQHYQDAQLSWMVNLHQHAPLERLALDTKRIKNFARIAGLVHLEIYSGSGDVTSEDITIAGVNGYGALSATGARIKSVNKQPLASSQTSINGSDQNNQFRDFVWSNGSIKLNSNELNQRARLSIDDKVTIRSPQLWANLLNEALANGIYDSAKSSLGSENNSNYSRILFRRFVMLEVFQNLFDFAIKLDVYESAFSAGALAMTMQAATLAVGVARGNNFRDYKWSIIPGLHYDRMLAAKIIPKLYPVVIPI